MAVGYKTLREKMERATGIEPATSVRLDLTDIRASYTMGLVGLSNFPTGEFSMALVKVKEKYQVTIPASLREKAGVEVGDIKPMCRRPTVRAVADERRDALLAG